MRLKRKERLGGSANEVYIVTEDTGDKWIWKPAVGTTDDIAVHIVGMVRKEGGHLREVGVYRIAEFLGLHGLVPETRLLKIDGKIGSLQRMVDGETENELRKKHGLAPYKGSDRSRGFHSERLAFDYLIGMHDRHSGNYMIDLKSGADRREFIAGYLIDNAESGGIAPWRDPKLHTRPGQLARAQAHIGSNRHKRYRSEMPDGSIGTVKPAAYVKGLPRRYTGRLIAGLRRFAEDRVVGQFGRYFTRRELLAMLERRCVILRHYQMLTRDRSVSPILEARLRRIGVVG